MGNGHMLGSLSPRLWIDYLIEYFWIWGLFGSGLLIVDFGMWIAKRRWERETGTVAEKRNCRWLSHMIVCIDNV